MPPPFAFFTETPPHDHLPHDETAEETAIKTERQYNALIKAIEQNGIGEIRAALREQELALLQSLDTLGADDVTRIVANTMKVMDAHADPLQVAIYRVLLTAARAGVVDVSQALPFSLSVGVDWTLPNKNAEQFALNYSYDLVSRVQQTTRKGIGQAVARWIREGGRLDELAESIRPLVVSEPSTRIIENLFSVDRATMIAETEATRAYAEGKVSGYLSSGLAHQAPTRIPPAHVRCRCDVRPDSDPDGSWWWIWLTANDPISQKCEVCGPLHKQRVGLARPAPQAAGKAIALADTPVGVLEQSFALRSKSHVAVYVNGRSQHQAAGQARFVGLNAPAAELSGSLVLHNHPEGLSFSVADVFAAHTHRLAELRAVGITIDGRAWRHVIRPNGKFFELNAGQLTAVIEPAKAAVTKELVTAVAGGLMTRQQANAEYWHLLWQRVERNLKGGARLGYKREALYG